MKTTIRYFIENNKEKLKFKFVNYKFYLNVLIFDNIVIPFLI